MAIAALQKFHLLAHSGVKMDVLSSLQEEGLIHLEEVDTKGLELRASLPEVSSIERDLARVSHGLTYLARWEKTGFVQKLISPKPQLSRRERVKALDFDYLSVLDRLERLEEEAESIESDIRFLKRENEFLLSLSGLDLPIKAFTPTESTELFLGILAAKQIEGLQRMADEEALWYEVIKREKRKLYLLLIYPLKEKEVFGQRLKELGFSPVYFTEHMLNRAGEEDRVRDVMENIDREIEEKRKRLEELEKEGQSLLVHRQKLMLVHDVLFNEREKISSSRLLGETERVFYLEGWVRSADVQKLESRLKPYSGVTEVFLHDPLPEEDPPVVLENPAPCRPFELVTRLYGLPRQKSFDPTLPMAPFFFLFVGLCVSEAGYGLLVTLLSLLFLKLARPRGGLRQFLTLMAYLGGSTAVLGALIGGWFGFPLRKLMIIDPLQDSLSFLGIALALGFIQVWFGTLLNMINGLKNKSYLQPIFVQGGWLLLLPSLVLYLYPQTRQSLWGILSLLGAAGIVFFAAPSRNPLARFFGGLYSLYDISRYLSDVLSYSRLLALGLATTVIAMVVNTLVQSVSSIPWVGWLLAAVIFSGGHLFNLAISFLGGFVHSMRLQFVEFFSKFFKAGGKPFKPFELAGKFVEFT